MSDLTQLVSDPAFCAQLQTFDPRQFIGLSGAPFIEQSVQYFKEQWALPTKLAPLAALILGVGINVGISSWLGLPVTDAVGVGAVTGLFASGWHMVSTK